MVTLPSRASDANNMREMWRKISVDFRNTNYLSLITDKKRDNVLMKQIGNKLIFRKLLFVIDSEFQVSFLQRQANVIFTLKVKTSRIAKSFNRVATIDGNKGYKTETMQFSFLLDTKSAEKSFCRQHSSQLR